MKSNIPFFSVIIPLYNKEEYISKCLNSVLSQTFNEFEIIIVNDGSTDKSVSIVETFKSNKIKLFHQDNTGVSKTRNIAANYAEGKYLAFLDADDIWKSNHLEKFTKSIEKFPNAGIYANNYVIKSHPNLTKPARFDIKLSNEQPFIVDNFFKVSSKFDTLIWTSATCIKKELFFNYGGFNINYTTAEDLDLWIRIALKESVVFNPSHSMIYNKFVKGSLSKKEHKNSRYLFFKSYEETQNIDLSRYLNKKRCRFALQLKSRYEIELYKKVKKGIYLKNLNLKQKILLSTPASILQLLRHIKNTYEKVNLIRVFKD